MRYKAYAPLLPSIMHQETVAGIDAGQVWINCPPEKTICFTGHRKLSPALQEELAARLDHTLATLYWEGKTCFLCGGALGFDTLAAEAVLRLKALYSDVKLVLAIPCADQPVLWTSADRIHWEELKSQADLSIVLSPVYYRGCMQVRNRFMVNHSSQVICYLTHFKGGTVSTVSYALQKGIHTVNLALTDCTAEPQP